MLKYRYFPGKFDEKIGWKSKEKFTFLGWVIDFEKQIGYYIATLACPKRSSWDLVQIHQIIISFKFGQLAYL